MKKPIIDVSFVLSLLPHLCRRESPMIYGSAWVSTSYRFQRIHIFLDL